METDSQFRPTYRKIDNLMKQTLCRSIAAVLVIAAGLLMMLSFQPAKPDNKSALRLAFEKMSKPAKSRAGRQKVNTRYVGSPSNLPTFGHPIIAGIGGTGFEESIRI